MSATDTCLVCGKTKPKGSDVRTFGFCPLLCFETWEYWLDHGLVNRSMSVRRFYLGLMGRLAITLDGRFM